MCRITLLLTFFYSSLWADTLVVAEQGRYQLIQNAISAAQEGDTVIVENGFYQENGIVVDKAITITGREYPIIDGIKKGNIFLVTANGVTIEGLQIQNAGTSYTKDIAGIKLQGVEKCIIRDNRVFNCYFGIHMAKSKNCSITNNQITGEANKELNSGNAIHLWYCNKIEILGNQLTHHRDGIYLEFVDNSNISGNISRNNLRYGLHFMFSNDDRYTDNLFEANGAGVAVMFSRNILMSKNLFKLNWGSASYGLLLKEIYDGEISDNIFDKNSIGIYAESTNRLDIKNNDFKANGWALNIMGSCMDNSFTANNFYSNTFDLSTSGKSDFNTYQGNYWSSYTGYDLDRNGYGDVPYRPVKMFSYLVGRVETSIILLRSVFIEVLNFTEKVAPVFIPDKLMDPTPLMKPRS